MNAGGSLCNMNALQHINAWQSLFVATTPSTILSFLILALLLVSFLLRNDQENHLSKKVSSIFKYQSLNALISDPLRVAFRKGILHPRRYDA